MSLDLQVGLDQEGTVVPQDQLVPQDLWDPLVELESRDHKVLQAVLDLLVPGVPLELLDHRAELEPRGLLAEWALMDQLDQLANR